MAKGFDAALVLFVLLALISFDVRPAGRSDLEEEQSFRERTETRRYELNSPEGAERARLLVRARVRSGGASWSLTDPDGETCLTGHAREGRVETDTGELADPAPGVWILTIELRDATGHYSVDWSAG